MRALFTIVALISGCVEEPLLYPAEEVEDATAAPHSPWDELSEAGGPDLLLGVAWHPLVEVDGDWTVAPLRYSVVDRTGVVRVDFELPWPAGQVTHLDLDAAGGGRLLATAVRSDNSPIGPDGFVWRTLRLDATDGSTTEVLRLTDTGELELPRTGRALAIDAEASVARVAADFDQSEGLWFLPETEDGRVGDLIHLDTADPSVDPRVYEHEDWLPSDLVGADGDTPDMAWTMQSSPLGPGLAVGLDGAGKGEGQRRLLTWSPDEGLGASLDLSTMGDLALRVEPSWRSGAGAGHALFQRGAATPFCAEPNFVVVGGDEPLEVDAGGDLDCGWSGPLLDPTAPTFAWFGYSVDGAASHRLRISHRGVDVVDLGTFTDGIVERPFFLLEAVELTLD